ncbi:MAG: preprotein translocase subunit SecG [Phycisphaerales bacterium]|nr:preprotein translocase subunit SecG [Phycisphaerales bacterium]
MSLILGQSLVDVLSAMFFGFIALLLIAVILLQRGRGVGLAGAFGGAGGNTAFGAKTGDVLTWVTVVLAAFFLLTAVLFNYQFRPRGSTLSNRVIAPVPVPTQTTPTPAPVSVPIPEATPPADEPATEAAPETPATEMPAADAPIEPPATGEPNGRGPATPADTPKEPNKTTP